MTSQNSLNLDQDEQALVSVIMNCYNGEKYLREAIDSVSAQTYKNWEIIFWDNQSTDQSAEIYKSYNDPRLKYFYAPAHTLLYEARNYAIEKASGNFFAFLDVDDWWHPEKLEKQIPLFDDPEVGIVCGNYWIFSERKNKRWKLFKKPAPIGWVLNELLNFYFVGLLTLVVRRSALASLDYQCNPQYHMIGDMDLVVRLSIHWKLNCEQDPVGFYRWHGGNESLKHQSRFLSELEGWLREMSENEVIRLCPGLKSLKNIYTYQKALYQLFQSDRKGAYRLSNDLPWGRLKFKLWVGLLLPIFVARRLRT